ncbi:MAG: DegT/DnrJ/EryC1/StrS family aminotransferase, partial [Steroidobacteraceae bacterium]|nr:DegT/DnrJ/EryC1/StrS family aminotransferase [Steroidobacteraceae bacterium]
MPTLLDLPHKVMTNSGRAAIAIALRLIGVQEGDSVLVPTYHCPTMVAPVEKLRAKPIFYPIGEDGLPDLGAVEALICKGVRAMLVAHLFGLPQRIDRIAQFCSAYRIALIEDCAHCLYGAIQGIPVGSTGDYAIGSLPKFLPLPQGGVLASRSHSLESAKLASRPLIDEMRGAWDMIDIASQYGRLGLIGTIIRALSRWRRRKADTATSYEPIVDDTLLRLRSQSDPLLRELPLRRVEMLVLKHSDLAAAAHRRRECFAMLSAELSQCRGVNRPFPNCSRESAPYVFPIVVRQPDEVYAEMRRAGLPVFRWDRLWPGTPRELSDVGFIWSRQLIQVACHQSLTDRD